MIYSLADFIAGIIESAMMFMLYETFCKRVEHHSKWLYAIGIIVLAIMINISNNIFDYGLLNAVGMIFSFIIISILYEGNFKTKFILSVLNFLLIVITEIMVLYGIVLVCKISVSDAVGIPSYRLLGIFISKMLLFIFVNTIRLKYKKKQVLFRASYWLLFLIMFTTSIIAVFLIFTLSYNINEKYMYNLSGICSFGLLFSTFFALFLYEHLSEQSEIIYNQQQYERHLKSQIKHLDEMLVAQKQLKKFKHDFSHYIIGLQAYIKNKKYDKAETYLEKLSNEVLVGRNMIETGNIALDAILSTKGAIAESKKIQFDTKIQIPEKLPIEDIDICVIFGNALDNAIEACARINECSKYINIALICQGESLFCRIMNSAPHKTLLDLKTHKADKNNHGFGLENIKIALSKYNSVPTVEYSGNCFVLKFIIFFNKE